VKAINHAAQHEFQVWGRRNLGSRLVIQDVDAWTLCASDGRTREPFAIIELKRSHIDPAEWWPYAQDRPQYAAGLRLAERAGVPYAILYYRKGVEIDDETTFHLFRLTHAEPKFRGTRRLLTAAEFRRGFPDVLVTSARAAA
jgi:hypothetical protein